MHTLCRSDDEDESEAPVLEQAWQINPHDIFFCSKSNGKLCRLGKGAFGTVRSHMLPNRACADVDFEYHSLWEVMFLQEQ